MLNTILIGIFIGLCASVPTGPLGVLCIQRTISRGKLHGFVTGLGATTSDLIYALLVSLGMSYIINFIESNQTVIQIAGSAIIGLLGLHIFLNRTQQSSPTRHNSQTHKISKSELFNDYISALLLCLSNPLIVFLYIGLFAQFAVFDQVNRLKAVICLASIAAGAVIWWLILILIVGKFRSRFGMRGLSILNKITGSALMLFALGTAISALKNHFMP